MNIIVAGSIMMDQIFRLDHLPKPGESMLAREVINCPGGKGANQAVGVARLGAKVKMIGRVGNDGFGQTMRDSLVTAGVNIEGVKVDSESPTGVALIMLAEGIDNSIVVNAGANMQVSPKDIDAVDFTGAEALLIQLETPLETVEHAMRRARQSGLLVVLDPGPARECPDSIIALADILTPNETEAEALTGLQVTDRSSAEQAAKKLLQLGPKRVILKMGARGVIVCDESGCSFWPIVKVDAVDTTAAGDAFCAALTVKLAGKGLFEEALTYSVYAGALAATKLGAQPSLPTAAEIEKFMKERPYTR
jgi:ribokinase